ncbi:MAG TPA: TRAP transporter small permease [Acetobacteraceae bacterium]|nr:TRAP transporter small permease [Acetobacteraceae bacterium]
MRRADRLLGAERLPHVWNWTEQTLAGLLGLIALAIGLIQVVGRYVTPQHAISYAEEVIVYLVIWAIMLTSSQLVRTDGHVRPDVVLRIIPVRVQRWVEVFNCIVALVFCGGLVWYGVEIVQTARMLDERSSTALQFPMWIYYLALPTGGGLMAIRYADRLWRYLFRYDPSTMSPGHGPHDMPLDAPPAD